MNTQETICAIATAQGGAIGIIRVSGPQAIQITDRIFTPSGTNAQPLTQRKAYTLCFGQIKEETGEIVDEVLVSIFRAPHSYTGEDATEISCHGSAYILQRVIQLLLKEGCRSANPGEFTQRAFLNGKMDLSQAEAVADLIASSSAATHRLAMNQMRGGFSKELAFLRDKLLHLTSLIELELDFSDHEDLEFADRSELQNTTATIEKLISHLAGSFKVGNAIKSGIPVAIVGETNSGKSTLLNTLLNEEKAIISDIQGTTRDVIEDTVNIDGIIFRFIDTAGIRETHDAIEAIGIERSFQAIQRADIVLWVIDQTKTEQEISSLSAKIIPACHEKKLVLILNKSDLKTSSTSIGTIGFPEDTRILPLSAKFKIGIEDLKKQLIKTAELPAISQGDVIVTNIRHYEALTHALEAIHRVQEGLQMNLPGDLISQDLRECIFYLNDIIGEIKSESVLNNIFKNFCVGK